MMKKRNYIGLSCTGHDNAIAVVDSTGRVRFAESAERYLQDKRAFFAPPDNFFHLEQIMEAHCEPDAEIVLAKSWSTEVQQRFRAEAEHVGAVAQQSAAVSPMRSGLLSAYCGFLDIVVANVEAAGTSVALRTMLDPSHTLVASRRYDHHLCHATFAAYTSPFDDAVVVVVDGFGEGTSVEVYRYQDGELEPVGDPQPAGSGMASLGLYYGLLLCPLCGFDFYRGEEWKVMGLAALGSLDEGFLRASHDYLEVHGNRFAFGPDADSAYERLLSFARRPGAPAESVANVAYTGQYFFAQQMTALLRNIHALGISDNLVLTGGCALNSSYSGHIVEDTPFARVHVPCAPADDGNAIGAALLAFHEDHPEVLLTHAHASPYLGSVLSRDAIARVAELGGIAGLEQLEDGELVARVAKLLASGKIVAWAQGNAEFGPRALGNRSILADPRDPGMKDRINARVKFREEFRPFAPSILHSHGAEYFECYQESWYMERTLRFRDEVRARVPAVVHDDGTGRVQTIKREWNPRFHALVESFHALTGIPLVLNTSLNVMGKPIVHSVEDILGEFFSSGLDVLVMEDVLVEKPAPAPG